MGIPKGPELLIILLIIVILFGARKIPELARSLGKSARELQRGFEEEDVAEAQAQSVEEEDPAGAQAQSVGEEGPKPFQSDGRPG